MNLENQIKAEEVPWINKLKQAIPVPLSNLDPMYIISGTESLVNFAQNKFPQTTLPNKFVSALYDTNKEADLTYPLTKELAFDIFEGQFSKSFVDSAREAASIMPNTIYARYYGLDYKKLRDKLRLDSDFDHSKYKDLGLCLMNECSVNVPKEGGHTARNACILENQQIITTHNLASNMINLGLQKKTEDKGGQMAVDCAKSIVADVRSLQNIQQGIDMNNLSYKVKLHKIMAIAKAWRQMLFYLSFSKRNRDQELIEILRQIPEKIVPENKKAPATQAINELEHLLSVADDPESTENKKKFTPKNPILGSTLDGSKFPF